MNNKSLAQYRKDIKDGILAILKDNQLDGQLLSDVKSIHYGNRTKQGDLKLPSVWVIPASHVPQQEGSHRMMHDFTFDFVALVRSNDPDKGFEAAEDLAARIYDIITEDRSLRGNVFDVIPLRIDPSFEVGTQNTQTYWAAIQVAFRVNK